MDNKQREAQLRRKLKKIGCRLMKSRVRKINLDNLGDYMVVLSHNQGVVFGSRYDATLDQVEAFVNEQS